jgi:hypothetical protein
MTHGSASTTRHAKNELIIGVGWHAYVNWARPAAGQPPSPVPMIDGSGARMDNDLADGQEVEILSWRPRSREGLAYRIRRLSDGSEWWIAATYLRRAAAPQVADPLRIGDSVKVAAREVKR